jgi:hypothetical protein
MKSEITIPLKEFIAEHKRLIKTLEQGIKSKLKKEAKDQSNELKKVLKKNSK